VLLDSVFLISDHYFHLAFSSTLQPNFVTILNAWRPFSSLKMYNKPRTISERLADAAKNTFVGRKAEFNFIPMTRRANECPFIVAFIYGPGGVGKSHLLRAGLDDPGFGKGV